MQVEAQMSFPAKDLKHISSSQVDDLLDMLVEHSQAEHKPVVAHMLHLLQKMAQLLAVRHMSWLSTNTEMPHLAAKHSSRLRKTS